MNRLVSPFKKLISSENYSIFSSIFLLIVPEYIDLLLFDEGTLQKRSHFIFDKLYQLNLKKISEEKILQKMNIKNVRYYSKLKNNSSDI